MTERYLFREAARAVLHDMGLPLSDRQIRRAMEPDDKGMRKLPFFRDPVTGRLVIAESKLRSFYAQAQDAAATAALPRRR